MATHQIVYLSRAVRRFNDQDLKEIEEEAAANNRRDGLTGLLVYDGTRFLQAIEGSEHLVRQTMKRILSDPRHDAIDIVTDRTVDKAQFGDWAMILKRAEPGTCSRRFITNIKDDIEQLSEPALQAIFIGFALLGCRPDPRA